MITGFQFLCRGIFTLAINTMWFFAVLFLILPNFLLFLNALLFGPSRNRRRRIVVTPGEKKEANGVSQFLINLSMFCRFRTNPEKEQDIELQTSVRRANNSFAHGITSPSS